SGHGSGEAASDRPSLLGGEAPKAKKPRAPFPEAGTTWFGFELLGELGRGAFSQVYLARQDDLAGRLVALKVSREAWVESQRLAQLQHSHIMPVYSVHKLGDFHAVVMPYLGSTTLADVLSGLRRQVAPPHSGNYFAATVEARDLTTNGHLEASPDDETLTPYAEESVRNVPLVVSPQNSAPRTKRITRGGNGSTIRNSDSEHDSTLGGGSDPRSGRAMRKVRSAAAQAGRGAGWLGLGDLSYVDAVLWMGVRLADGLAHAHERGIVHCDLKPANVLLSEDGQPLLLDFNLAADTKIRNDADERIGGTLPYMAPEQMSRLLDGKGDVDHRSDIYSLGVMLYELLTGQAAFPQHEGPWREVVVKLREERQTPPGLNRRSSGDSPAVEAIIRRCLEPDVSRRYQTAEELREDLERQLNHLPLVHASNPSWGELASKWLQRHPRATSGGTVALVAALILSVAAGAAWSFDRQRQRMVSVEQARTTLDELRQATQLLSDPGLDSERRATLEEICQRVASRYGISTDRRW
ncbi:MAG TPA: serine/threonine-protein kinase, partial [Pirellulaceae bacterium]|nr:serine/threonine-protein kinase [Pirellulaceae bacterium]